MVLQNRGRRVIMQTSELSVYNDDGNRREYTIRNKLYLYQNIVDNQNNNNQIRYFICALTARFPVSTLAISHL